MGLQVVIMKNQDFEPMCLMDLGMQPRPRSFYLLMMHQILLQT